MTTAAITPPSRTGASYATTAAGLAKRTLLQFFRTPQILFMGMDTGHPRTLIRPGEQGTRG